MLVGLASREDMRDWAILDICVLVDRLLEDIQLGGMPRELHHPIL